MNPAPTEIRTSIIGNSKPDGAPKKSEISKISKARTELSLRITIIINRIYL